MYSLRVIFPNGVVRNYVLGTSYTLTKDYDAEAFNQALRKHFKLKEDQELMCDAKPNESAYAIVGDDNGQDYILYPFNQYYIVMSNGNTYENLTKR